MWERIGSLALVSALCVMGQGVAKIGLGKIDQLGLTPIVENLLKLVRSPYLWIGGILLVVGTLYWFTVLKRLELSVALPVTCVLTLVFSVLFSLIVFGEHITLMRGVGLGLAVVSVALIAT